MADLAVAATPNAISREGASRRIDVMCNVRGRDPRSVAREIEQKVRAVPFDRGYHQVIGLPEVCGLPPRRWPSAARPGILPVSVVREYGPGRADSMEDLP